VRKRVGWVNAEARYPGWLNGRLALSLRATSENIESKGLELAERLGLDLDRPLRQLSRGNLQKVGLMLALAPEPSLLLLDEPTSGLDPLMQEVFSQIIHEENARGTTVLLSSHTFSEVEKLCQTLALVKGGEIVARDTLSSFKKKARRRLVLHLKEALPENLPESLTVISYQENRLLAFWTGELDELLHFVNHLSLDDLEITAPLLDEAFLEHYS
jgi:beta-exotoxin I transport system ATP-binding protein